MNDGKKVWAFTHATHEDLGSLQTILQDFGIRPTVFLAPETDMAALNADEPDLLIVMGGSMGIYDADNHPHLYDEMKIMQRHMDLGKPMLGICLGAQMIAQTLGAKVYKGPQGMEVGWHPIQVNADGMRTPVKYFDAVETNMMHWHRDTFDMPDGVTLLASNANYKKQAFSYGVNVLGLQFHPEVTKNKLERWYKALDNDVNETGTTVEKLRADAVKYAENLQLKTRLFFTEWLGQVAPQLLEKHILNKKDEGISDA